MLALLYDTGARVQELLDLCPVDFRLDRLPLVRITGKGRKQRIVPLLPATAKLVQNHLAETGCAPAATSPLLANHRGEKLTRSGVTFLLEHYRRFASEDVPTLQRAGISPHTFRRTKALALGRNDPPVLGKSDPGLEQVLTARAGERGVILRAEGA